MPRTLAKLSTFLVGGFVLHDLPTWILTRRILPPGATIAFVMFGLGAIASAQLGMDMSRVPLRARAAVNLTYLATYVGSMLIVVRLLIT